MPENLTVAVIGLGSMGLGMARALLAAGFAVRGYDPNPVALQSFGTHGGTACASAAEAARGAAVALLVVVNAQQTEAVLFGEAGIAAVLPKGSVVISSATMAPDHARDFARRAEMAGLHYLDAPLSGGAAKAAAGKLTIMASGTSQAFAAARPVLKAIAETVYELGGEAGIGASFKMVNQLLAGVHIAAACEAMAFASRLGLDLAKVFEVITKSAGNSWMFENRMPHVLAGDYTPLSAVSIFTKDLGILSDMARKQQFPLPVASTALQMFLMTESAGMGRDDDSSVARLYAKVSGVELPKSKT